MKAQSITIAALITLALITQTQPLEARTWYITPDGTGDAPTIQAGIDSAAVGDTVLVAPGLYQESIDYQGKDITVGSHFLVSGAPEDISATVISPPEWTSCVVFQQSETRQAVLKGFTLTDGWGTPIGFENAGGGVFIYQASPTLEDLVIHECHGSGAGVYIEEGAPLLKHLQIHDNQAEGALGSHGGGVFVGPESGPEIVDCLIFDNVASSRGGGICLFFARATLRDCEIRGNQANRGGGLALLGEPVVGECSGILTGNVIAGNRARYGGGIFLLAPAEITLQGDCLTGNHAQRGGGLYVSGDAPVNFHSITRCSVHGNLGLWGRDFCNTGSQVLLAHLDTFSVALPTAIHVYPPAQVTVLANVHRWSQVDADLFVAPDGDDAASGTSADQPLQTIHLALARLAPFNTTMRTIHLAPGHYAPSITGEVFPLALLDGVGLAGAGRELTILDPEQTDAAVVCGTLANISEDIAVLDLTITGAVNWGAIRCLYAEVELARLIIQNNSNLWQYGAHSTDDLANAGVLCHNALVHLADVDLIGNHITLRYCAGGLACRDYAVVLMERVLLAGNSSGWDGAGVTVSSGSRVAAFNCTITGSTGELNTAGIRLDGAYHLALVNCIVWDNQGPQVRMVGPDTLLFAYSDLAGGESGVHVEGSGFLDWREGNIDADPSFVAPEEDDYSLGPDSPCIDSGTAYFDWGDQEFVLDLDPEDYIGDAPDMGAREYSGPVGVEDIHLTPPTTRLGLNYPNPFNPSTTIRFTLLGAQVVQVNVYAVDGRRVATLINEEMSPGPHSVTWNGTDDQGRAVASGTYIYRLEAGDYVESKRMVLVR